MKERKIKTKDTYLGIRVSDFTPLGGRSIQAGQNHTRGSYIMLQMLIKLRAALLPQQYIVKVGPRKYRNCIIVHHKRASLLKIGATQRPGECIHGLVEGALGFQPQDLSNAGRTSQNSSRIRSQWRSSTLVGFDDFGLASFLGFALWDFGAAPVTPSLGILCCCSCGWDGEVSGGLSEVAVVACFGSAFSVAQSNEWI